MLRRAKGWEGIGMAEALGATPRGSGPRILGGQEPGSLCVKVDASDYLSTHSVRLWTGGLVQLEM